jgi:hypothetical protein
VPGSFEQLGNQAALSKMHLAFLWLFVLWLGGSGVMNFRLPVFVKGNAFFANRLALVTMTVELMPSVKGDTSRSWITVATYCFLRRSCASPGEHRGVGEHFRRLHCHRRLPV